jgi:hypothetical protein
MEVIMKIFHGIIILFGFLIVSCVTMDNGANWFYADFSAYEKNYNDFDTSLIEIGMTENAVKNVFPFESKIVEATADYKVIQFEKWRAVPGPDYLEQKLFIKIVSGNVTEFKLINDVAITNPW